ncbi:MAG: hypothetical protein A3J38_08010 [Gammaproteobacteria bacterium RIFCSPHIGHO2_12_FULL_45_9]|nr:MAG: hypothetical protein A3J38_08010 [Gammaproteobacteria bacterium RIFCSPHIGHO2_12_FULL_45_9]
MMQNESWRVRQYLIILGMGIALSGCLYNNEIVPQQPQENAYRIQAVHTASGWVAEPPVCPQVIGEDGSIQPSHNWGCSNTRNLGLMAADPRDFAHLPHRNQAYPVKPLSDAVIAQEEGKSPALEAQDGIQGASGAVTANNLFMSGTTIGGAGGSGGGSGNSSSSGGSSG